MPTVLRIQPVRDIGSVSVKKKTSIQSVYFVFNEQTKGFGHSRAIHTWIVHLKLDWIVHLKLDSSYFD